MESGLTYSLVLTALIIVLAIVRSITPPPANIDRAMGILVSLTLQTSVSTLIIHQGLVSQPGSKQGLMPTLILLRSAMARRASSRRATQSISVLRASSAPALTTGSFYVDIYAGGDAEAQDAKDVELGIFERRTEVKWQ